MNQPVVNNSVNSLHNLQFDVVAIPQNNISQILNERTGALFKTVNIKIRVRNKEEIKNGQGVISIPKLSKSGPRKVRLVSSDQTIISFDLLMGSESVKKIPKTSHSKFLQLFKASGCFNNQNDDDDYPYVPSSSDHSYRTRSVADVHDFKDDKIIIENFSLKKNLPPLTSTNTTLRTPTFLGKCKPGGCLDPPFDEDKYIYKRKLSKIDHKHANIQENTDENHIENYIVSKKIVCESDYITEGKSSNSSVEEIYRHVITYPPSEVQEETRSKKSNLTTSSENKIRKSFNEFSDTYFMPPRRKISKIDVKLSAEFLKIQSMSCNSINTNTDTRSSIQQKDPSQLLSLSNADILNQALGTIILRANSKDKNIERKKMESPEVVPVTDSNSKTFGKLSDSNIQVTQGRSLSEASAIKTNLNDDEFKENLPYQIKLERTENSVLDTRIGTYTALENNVENSKIFPFCYRGTIICDDLPKITRQGLKDENNGYEVIENNKLNNNENFVDTQSLVNLKLHEVVSTIDSIYNISEPNERKTKDFTPSDNDVLTSSNAELTEYLQETENLPQVTNIMTSKHNTGESIEHKDSATILHVQASSIKQIKDKELTDQLHLKQMRTSQAQLLKSTIMNYFKRKHTNVIHESEIQNNDYENDYHKPVTSTVESEAETRYDISNTVKNKLNVKPLSSSGSVILTSGNPESLESLVGTEIYPQATKPLTIYKHISESIEHNEDLNISYSQASLVAQTKITNVIGQINVENIKTSQALVDTTTKNYEEKKYINDLHGIENTNNIECEDDKSILSNAEKKAPLKNNLSRINKNELKLKPLTELDNTSIIKTNNTVSTTGNNYEEKIYITDLPRIETVNNTERRNYYDDQISTKSSLRINIAESDYSMKSANLTIKYSPSIVDSQIISKAMSQVTLTERIPDKETIDESLIYNKDSMGINQSFLLPTSFDLSPAPALQKKKSVTSQIQKKNEINEELVHYEHRNGLPNSPILNLSSPCTIPSKADTTSGYLQSQSHEYEQVLNSTISLKSQTFKENNRDGHSPSSSIFFRPKLQESLEKVMLKTIAQLQSNTNVISVISDTEKTGQSAYDYVDTIEKNLDNQPKNFLSESDSDTKLINSNNPKENFENLGATFTNNDNKYLEFGPLDKITVIKSTNRANDTERKIPITSETDITLKINKPFNQGNDAKRHINNTDLTNKVPEKSLSKTILLKETLDSVYEHLVPIHNIIRNLKQEAEILTREQVLFREILNELKNKSVKMTNTIRKCNCNKL